MKILISILILIGLQYSAVNAALSKSVAKKIDKNMARIWEAGLPVRKPVALGISQSKSLKLLSPDDSFYKLLEGERLVGFLVLTSSTGRTDTFDYMVIYDVDFKVLSVDILTYRSNYGSAVTSRKWLSQFKGYTGGELNYGKDIQAISGATLSASHLTEDIRKLTAALKELEY